MNFGNKYLEKFTNVFTPTQHKKILNTLSERRWSFDNWAGHEPEKGILCWSLWGLEEEAFYKVELLQRINQITGKTFIAERIYANGQSFGQDGVFHIDHEDPTVKAYTFLYYPSVINAVDVYEFGGETQFIQDDGQLYHVYPFTNSAVIFDAHIWHRGMGPNKWSKQLRTSLAFKLVQID